MLYLLSMLCTPLVYANPETIDSPAVVHHTTEAIQVDGLLNEDVWSQASAIHSFQRYIPTDGGSPPGKTEIRFVQDENTLYVGIRVSNANYPIQARISPREDVNDDDQIGIYLDPIGDGRTGYIFYLNPLGIQQDIRYSNGQWMVNWNTIFDTKGQVTETGYTIEMALPFKSIQYTEDGSWTVSMTRKIPSLGAKYSHPQRVRNHPQLFLQAVPLDNIVPPKVGAGIWLQPTLSGRHTLERQETELQWIEQELPAWETTQPSLDLRWGITSETAFTMTVNPDFSQVEGDVRQINLNQRFAFYYPERRPFFLSNMDSFQDTASSLYTRSIVNPIYGAKIAGREGDWDVGVLSTLDQQPKSSVHEFGAVSFDEDGIGENSAQSTYLRLRRDALSSGFIGVFATDKRILNGLKSLGFNDVFGLDFRSNIGTDTLLKGFSSLSMTGEHNTRDAVELGHRHNLSLSKTPDLGIGYSISLNASTPEYRQEMGFLTQSGLQTVNLNGQYTHQVGSDSLWKPYVSLYAKEEFDADGEFRISHGQEMNLKGLHTVTATAGWGSETYSINTVEGPFGSASWRARVNSKLNTVLKYDYDTSLDYGTGLLAKNQQTSLQWLWRPQSNLRLDVDLAQQWYQLTDAEVNSVQRVYSRLNWQFSQYLGSRVIAQTVQSSLSENNGLDSLFGSFLLSYIRNPGNEVYVGATWNWTPDTLLLPEEPNTEPSMDLLLQQQMLFVKWTHLFQY